MVVSSAVCCSRKRFIRSQFLKYWCKRCPIIFHLVSSPFSSSSPSTAESYSDSFNRNKCAEQLQKKTCNKCVFVVRRVLVGFLASNHLSAVLFRFFFAWLLVFHRCSVLFYRKRVERVFSNGEHKYIRSEHSLHWHFSGDKFASN